MERDAIKSAMPSNTVPIVYLHAVTVIMTLAVIVSLDFARMAASLDGQENDATKLVKVTRMA